jgi:hypothetical protein
MPLLDCKFKQPPSKEQRRRHPYNCVLHRTPAAQPGSYLGRLGSFKTSSYSSYIGAYKVPLSPSLHRCIMTLLRQQPRRYYLFEQQTRPG